MAKGQPLSIRLTDETALLVGDEARRSGRSRSAIVEELADEAAKMRLFPGIGFRDHPRRAWVIGTGLDVWQVVDLLDAYRGSVKKLCRDYPLVSERAVRIAHELNREVASPVEARRLLDLPTQPSKY